MTKHRIPKVTAMSRQGGDTPGDPEEPEGTKIKEERE
jgi:hypothetical protein